MFRLPGAKRLGFAISTLGGGVAFLTLNERRNVAAMKLRAIAEHIAVSLEETDVVNVDKSIDGKLVHYQGFLRPDEQPADHMFGVTNKQLVAIRRRVEMYQWMESSRTVTNKDKTQETVSCCCVFLFEFSLETGVFLSESLEHFPFGGERRCGQAESAFPIGFAWRIVDDFRLENSFGFCRQAVADRRSACSIDGLQASCFEQRFHQTRLGSVSLQFDVESNSICAYQWPILLC